MASGLQHVLFYDYVPDMSERRGPHRDGHLALIGRFKEEGRLAIAGALGDPPHGAALIFPVDDAAVVEEFVASDPYVAAELVTRWRVEPFRVVG